MSIEDEQSEVMGRYLKLKEEVQYHDLFDNIEELFDRFHIIYDQDDDNDMEQLEEILEEIDEIIDSIYEEI